MKTFLEALNDYQKKLVSKMATSGEGDSLSTLKHSGGDMHNEVFSKYNNGDENSSHVVLPYHFSASSDEPINSRLVEHLSKHGYEIHDYAKNQAVHKVENKFGHKLALRKISAALASTGGDKVMSGHSTNPEYKRGSDGGRVMGYDGRPIVTKQPRHLPLTEFFDSDPSRHNAKDSGLQIVLDRSLEGVGGMTSGRRWEQTSCMRLPDSKGDSGGGFHARISDDLKHGTIAAYLTTKGDHTAENPHARTLLKKFVSDDGHVIFRGEDKHYGNANDSLHHVVKKWAEHNYPEKPDTNYKLEESLYNDNYNGRQYRKSESLLEGSLTHTMKEYGFAENESTKHKTNAEGMLHTDNDEPSFHHKDYLETSLTAYHKNGLLHRDPKLGPAAVHTDAVGRKTVEYYENGKLSRKIDGDEPSYSRERFGVGSFEKKWARHGVTSRNPDLGPAYHVVDYPDTDHESPPTREHKFYAVNGIEHNPNGYSLIKESNGGDHHSMEKHRRIFGAYHTDSVDMPSRHEISNSKEQQSETKEYHTHGVSGTDMDVPSLSTKLNSTYSGRQKTMTMVQHRNSKGKFKFIGYNKPSYSVTEETPEIKFIERNYVGHNHPEHGVAYQSRSDVSGDHYMQRTFTTDFEGEDKPEQNRHLVAQKFGEPTDTEVSEVNDKTEHEHRRVLHADHFKETVRTKTRNGIAHIATSNFNNSQHDTDVYYNKPISGSKPIFSFINHEHEIVGNKIRQRGSDDIQSGADVLSSPKDHPDIKQFSESIQEHHFHPSSPIRSILKNVDKHREDNGQERIFDHIKDTHNEDYKIEKL